MNIGKEIPVFAERLKELRKAAGFTQAELYEKISGSNESKTIRNWEYGKTMPNGQDLLKLCEIFNCDCDYLLGRIDAKTHDLQFISEKTGLTEDAIKILNEVKIQATREPDGDLDTIPAKNSLYLATLNQLINLDNNILEDIMQYLYLNVEYYYDDYTYHTEDYYNHISELGFFDKKLGLEFLIDPESISQIFILELQKHLSILRSKTQANLPKRITPIADAATIDDDSEFFDLLDDLIESNLDTEEDEE